MTHKTESAHGRTSYDLNDATIPPAAGILRRDDHSYPQILKITLGSKAPETVYFLGNTALLNDPGLAICGSRKASDKGLRTAQDCANQAAKASLVVVSGYASGVDLAAHHAALAAGGTTIMVIAEGIDHFKIKKPLRDVWDWSRILVLSQCQPHETWQAYLAMNRNQVIIGLSRSVIVIEAQANGGAIAAGKSALKLKVPLFVAEYQDMSGAPGNSQLLRMGAFGIRKSRSANRAQLSPLFSALKLEHQKNIKL